MKILIIGGGIGGLVTALALDRVGIEVHVLEAATALRPLGLGINVLPHAVRHLDEIGAMEPLLDIGIETTDLAFFTNRGQEVWREPRGKAAGYRWPQISIHRGQMQAALLELAHRRFGAGNIHLGRRLVRFEQDGDSAVAHLIGPDGAAAGTVVGDALIGADGIHSAVRRQMHPDEGPPHWNGGLIYRAASEGEPFLSGRTQMVIGGRQTFLGYSMSKPAAARGRPLINWAARFFVDTSRAFPPEEWNRPGRLEDFLPRYENWRFGWFDVPSVIRAAPAVFEFPMVDRDPIPHWTRGRVTLLGDAAHAMVPLGSNGASQAILDAAALAREFATCKSVPGALPDALQRYEADRRPKTTQIVAMNRRGGPERVIRIAEERAPGGFEHIHDVIPADELRQFAEEYKRIASFDLASVNT